MSLNRKEELAEYIIKNLTYTAIFAISATYLFSSIILPKVDNYKAKREDVRYTQLAYLKAFDQNSKLEKTIQTSQEKNKKLTHFLFNPPSSSQIQAIAQEFFDVTSMKKSKSDVMDIFAHHTLEIQGTSNSTQAFFDFSKKIRELYPNVTLSLPLIIEKKDLLSDTLEFTFCIKITQILKKN